MWVRWANLQPSDVKFLQGSVCQKWLKSVHFWRSYSKNRNVIIFWDTVYVCHPADILHRALVESLQWGTVEPEMIRNLFDWYIHHFIFTLPNVDLPLTAVFPSCPWCSSLVFWCCQLNPLSSLMLVSKCVVPCHMLSYNLSVPCLDWCAFFHKSLSPSCQWATGPLYLVYIFDTLRAQAILVEMCIHLIFRTPASSLKVVGRRAVGLLLLLIRPLSLSWFSLIPSSEEHFQ